eukprot:1194352-Prorocentrum_minimum.AAC.3
MDAKDGAGVVGEGKFALSAHTNSIRHARALRVAAIYRGRRVTPHAGRLIHHKCASIRVDA